MRARVWMPATILCLIIATPVSFRDDFWASALMDAQKAWGWSVDARIRMVRLSDCTAGTVSAHAARGTVEMNSTCRWMQSAAAVSSARRTVVHEVGHLLGVGHSMDEHSVMFWMDDGQESAIMDEDRARVKRGRR